MVVIVRKWDDDHPAVNQPLRAKKGQALIAQEAQPTHVAEMCREWVQVCASSMLQIIAHKSCRQSHAEYSGESQVQQRAVDEAQFCR